MSFSNRILIGLASGVALGLFLGEYARALQWAADGFVKLLQMTVLPYVIVSIVSSLGALQIAEARSLGLRAGAVVLGLWLLALVFAFLFPLAFPRFESASFFSTTLVEERPPFDFIGLYIPSNPFYSLANNIVPAVVLFSVLLGVALIGVEQKQTLLEVLSVLSEAIARATRFIVRLTPYGLFAVAASAAGTLSLEQVERLQVYLTTYIAVALLVGLWVLPGLVGALTPIRPIEILRLTQSALVTAFVAGDLFIVLPMLIEASKELLTRYGVTDARSAALPDVIVPASFNFPHTGKLLSISFILFAGWFADAVTPVAEYPRLALTGLVTFFGSLNAAVPFLLDLFRIPADTFQLFLATGVINSRFGSFVAAVHTVSVALLGTCAIRGAVRLQPRRLLRYAGVTALLSVFVIGGVRVLFSLVLSHEYEKDRLVTGLGLLLPPAEVFVHREAPTESADETGRPRLAAIRDRGVLRVGYAPDSLPFAYFNAHGDLVGLDIEMSHQLARELGVGVEFIPIDRERIREPLVTGACDIIMTGVAATTERALDVRFSRPYLDETVAFVVRDYDRSRFESWDAVRLMGAVRLGVPNVPYYLHKVRELLPEAQLHILKDLREAFTSTNASLDAVLLPAERGSAWTLLYPAFTVVVPKPGVIKVPLAYVMPPDDEPFARFVDTWLELKQREGLIDELYRHWILGRSTEIHRQRWSVVRDVLHWVD
jgi:Na+/H+-dicarboxylate symporter/ABC-type amino acid transport substrate-binding protein